MNTPDKIFKHKSKEFLDRVIYPSQFKNESYKIIYHIINVCRPLLDQKYIPTVVKNYVPHYDREQLDLALQNYIQNKKTLFRYQCFTHIENLLKDQDLFFMQSGKKRYVTLKEYRFLLQRITKNLYESRNCKSVMINRMFETMKPEYFENTGRKLNEHKLSYILQILQKHKYFHVTYNAKNQRVVQIGPNNPYYQLKKVPDIDHSVVQEVLTKTDREILELKSKLEIYEHVREEDLATICSLTEERDRALDELENIKTENQSLTEMHQEDIAEIQQLRTTMQSDGFCSNR